MFEKKSLCRLLVLYIFDPFLQCIKIQLIIYSSFHCENEKKIDDWVMKMDRRDFWNCLEKKLKFFEIQTWKLDMKTAINPNIFLDVRMNSILSLLVKTIKVFLRSETLRIIYNSIDFDWFQRMRYFDETKCIPVNPSSMLKAMFIFV